MIIKDGGVVACLGVVGSQVFMMTSSRGSACQDNKNGIRNFRVRATDKEFSTARAPDRAKQKI